MSDVSAPLAAPRRPLLCVYSQAARLSALDFYHMEIKITTIVFERYAPHQNVQREERGCNSRDVSPAPISGPINSHNRLSPGRRRTRARRQPRRRDEYDFIYRIHKVESLD
ncbi:hypothetical protein EVAR_19380_1 [Eumeta japonica]|uniref:Uncharacterized protein n=1 Tax=Eumeta variegata TaxID=151549 RepID=A0A4C1TRH3_EUMVA|nr:hypothetical protein EVAR_19380_1 [Eumeta japonica]